jgi:diguanylate cyclase (GGDEF)-like protein/PAS domain S-box-containing protein
LNYVDAMHRHGVYIGLLEVVSSGELMAALQASQAVRPKVTTVRKNELAFVLQIDPAMTEILGWAEDEMVGRRSLDFIDPEDHQRAITNWMDMLRVPGSRRRVRLRHRHRDGSWVWFDVTNHNLLKEPSYGYVLTEMLDVTDEMTAQEALRERESFLRRLAEAIPLGICQIDTNRRVVYRNRRCAAILGGAAHTSIEQQLANVVPVYEGQLEAALDATLFQGADVDLEVQVRTASGEVRRCSSTLHALSNEYGQITGAILCFVDITESVRMREELQHRATCDLLTGSQNRASILDTLERTLHDAAPIGRGTAVVFLDLDHFKEVNDRLGHAVGDEFLVEVVKRLKRSVRDTDTVGRLGGDEFLIVCADVPSKADALELANRIGEGLADGGPLQVGGERLQAQASIGVAWSDGPTTADALVASADHAMYGAKRARLGRSAITCVAA